MSLTPVNAFKQALAAQEVQIGFWLALADPYSAEICAGAGFDWLLIDGEHSPQTLPLVLGQLQAIAGRPSCHAVVRVASDDPVAIKQHLDLGVQNLLVPMVDTAEQAAGVVRSCRYPPEGIRGVGGGRASAWGRNPRYVHEASDQLCVMVQVETERALGNLEEIAAVEGIDGVFVGPADLAASMGHLGDPGHADVKAAVVDALGRVRAAGKAPGVLTPVEALTHEYLAAGAVFAAVGVDTYLLARQTSELAARFGREAPPRV